MYFPPLISSTRHILLLATAPERLAWAVKALKADRFDITVGVDGRGLQDRLPDLILFVVQEASRIEQDTLRALKIHPMTASVPILFLYANTVLTELWPIGRDSEADNIRIEPLSPRELRKWVQTNRVHYGLAVASDPVPMPLYSATNDDEHALVRAAKNYLSTYHAKVGAVDGVAKALAVDATWLADVFYAGQGLTLSEFLTQERMRSAQRLLLQSSLGIGAIASAVGYATQAEFVADFRALTNLTPAAYRRDSSVDSLTTQGVVLWSSS